VLHWYSDEKMAIKHMREVQRQADRAQAWGLYHREVPTARLRIQRRMGHWLIALGQYLQRGKEIRGEDVAPSSQCGLR
jgi:hypothetical protein